MSQSKDKWDLLRRDDDLSDLDPKLAALLSRARDSWQMIGGDPVQAMQRRWLAANGCRMAIQRGVLTSRVASYLGCKSRSLQTHIEWTQSMPYKDIVPCCREIVNRGGLVGFASLWNLAKAVEVLNTNRVVALTYKDILDQLLASGRWISSKNITAFVYEAMQVVAEGPEAAVTIEAAHQLREAGKHVRKIREGLEGLKAVLPVLGKARRGKFGGQFQQLAEQMVKDLEEIRKEFLGKGG